MVLVSSFDDQPADCELELELFIVGASPKAEEALRNVQAICARYLFGPHSLTVTDLEREPARAQQDNKAVTY